MPALNQNRDTVLPSVIWKITAIFQTEQETRPVYAWIYISEVFLGEWHDIMPDFSVYRLIIGQGMCGVLNL